MGTKPRTIRELWKVLDDARGSTRPRPATAAAIARLAKRCQDSGGLPEDLRLSLSVHDGGVHLDSYDLLPVKAIPSWTRLMPHSTAVAFAADSGGNLLGIDHRGRLLGFERGSTGHFVKARSAGAWFETLVKGLARGTYVAEDGGIVEKVLEPSVPAAPDESLRIEHPFADQVFAIVKAGKLKALQALVADGTVAPTAHFWTGQTLIGRTAAEHQLGLVKFLLAKGCPVDHGASLGKRTALFEACWGKGDAALVEFLLARGADPNAMTSYDGTPLHSALMFDNLELAKKLIAAGADPKRANAKGETAALIAKKKKIALGA